MRKLQNTLFITTQGCYLHKERETLVVAHENWRNCPFMPLRIFFASAMYWYHHSCWDFVVRIMSIWHFLPNTANIWGACKEYKAAMSCCGAHNIVCLKPIPSLLPATSLLPKYRQAAVSCSAISAIMVKITN